MANDKSAGKGEKKKKNVQEQGSGIAAESVQERRLHKGIYDHAEKTELGPEKSGQGASDERHGNHQLTFPAWDTTFRNTQWCWCAAEGLRTFRASGIT